MVRRIDKQSFGYGTDPALVFERVKGKPSQKMLGKKALENVVDGVYLNGSRIFLDDPEVQHLIDAGGEDLLPEHATEMTQVEVDEKFADIVAKFDNLPSIESVNTNEKDSLYAPMPVSPNKWNAGRKSALKK